MKNKVLNPDAAEIHAEQGHIENMPSVIFVSGKREGGGRLELILGGTGILMVTGELHL